MCQDTNRQVVLVNSAGNSMLSLAARNLRFIFQMGVMVLAAVLGLQPTGEALAAQADATYNAGRREWGAGEYEKALALFLDCAKAGHGGCMQSVSSHYLNGRGVKQDYAAAMAWALKAHATGTRYGLAGAYAARDIGIMLRQGQGVPRNVDEGVKWFDKASSLAAALATDRRFAGAQSADVLRRSQAYIQFQLTLSWFLKGDLKKALASTDRAIALDPDVAWYHGARGVALDRLGDHHSALTAYGEAIRIDPKDYRGYKLRSVNAILRGGFAEAINDISAWSARRPDDLFAPLLHYVVRLKTGVPEAEAAKALALLPERTEWPWPVIDLMLGRASVEAVLAAARSFEPYLAQGREGEVYFYLGEQRLAQGDAAAAGELLRKAVAMNAFDYYEYWMAKAELARLGLQ